MNALLPEDPPRTEKCKQKMSTQITIQPKKNIFLTICINNHTKHHPPNLENDTKHNQNIKGSKVSSNLDLVDLKRHMLWKYELSGRASRNKKGVERGEWMGGMDGGGEMIFIVFKNVGHIVKHRACVL